MPKLVLSLTYTCYIIWAYTFISVILSTVCGALICPVDRHSNMLGQMDMMYFRQRNKNVLQEGQHEKYLCRYLLCKVQLNIFQSCMIL